MPRNGRPQRLDTIIVRQQILNIPWTYYKCYSDAHDWSFWQTNSLVTLLPTVAHWYELHFNKFIAVVVDMPNMASCSPLTRVRQLLAVVATSTRPPRQRKHPKKTSGTTPKHQTTP